MWINKIIIKIIYHLLKLNGKLLKDNIVYLLNTNLYNNYNHNLANEIYTEAICKNLIEYNKITAELCIQLKNKEKLYGWSAFVPNRVRLSKLFINDSRIIEVNYNIKLFKQQYISLNNLFNKINKEEDNYNYRIVSKYIFYLDIILNELIKLSFK